MTSCLLESRLTCPVCAHAETLAMPTDACQWFSECPAWKILLKTQARRLLRVLFLWQRALSTNPGGMG